MQRKTKENQCFRQNVQCVIVKNRDLLRSMELVDYLRNLGLKIPLCKIPLLSIILL